MRIRMASLGLILGMAVALGSPASADMVRAKTFAEFMPAGPDGWWASKPHSESKEIGSTKVALALRSYQNRRGKGSFNLEIKDEITKTDKVIVNTPKSFGMKSTTIKGLKASYEGCVETKRTGAYYIIAGRYLVKLTCSEISRKLARSILAKIDFKGLAAVK